MKITVTDEQLDAVLCYVEDNKAFFTTCPLDKQWGDDWNDAPYEHNAEEPYGWAEHCDIEPYGIVKVCFDHHYFEQPRDGHLNSPFSVEAINRGDIAWLRPGWNCPKGWKPIYAGTTLRDFIKMVTDAGAAVYLPVKA